MSGYFVLRAQSNYTFSLLSMNTLFSKERTDGEQPKKLYQLHYMILRTPKKRPALQASLRQNPEEYRALAGKLLKYRKHKFVNNSKIIVFFVHVI